VAEPYRNVSPISMSVAVTSNDHNVNRKPQGSTQQSVAGPQGQKSE
jgi:hypothetical protein